VSEAYCKDGTRQVPTFIFVLDVSAAARTSGLLGAELKAVKNTLDSIYEWLQSEAGGGERDHADGGGGGDDSSMVGSGLDDRSGASLHASVSSAQALYGTRSLPADQHSHSPPADTNGLFRQPSLDKSQPDASAYGPIRVGIVTFDSHVQFYSVREDAFDPVSKFLACFIIMW
jgi:hypothetical protein